MTRSARSRPPHRRLAGAALAAAVFVAGCAVAPATPTTPPPLDDLLQQAETSRAGGDRELARRQWHEATRLHPLSPLPWRRLAEDHFRAGENGSAIVAAQEAARRDPQDPVAHSILAVGGLRVSSAALVTLRERDGVPADTQGEATALTRLLRETLGEPVLVPAPEPPPARTRRGARPATVAASPGGSATPLASGVPAARPQTPPTASPAAAPASTTSPPVAWPPVAAPRPATAAPSARVAAPAGAVAAEPGRPSPALVSLPSANPFDRLR